MGKVVGKLFGIDTKGQEAAIAAQRAEVEAEARRVSTIEAGQRRVRNGGGGFRAFVDDQLKTLFGG